MLLQTIFFGFIDFSDPSFRHDFGQKINSFHLKYENNVDTCCQTQTNTLFYNCERDKMRHVKK